MLGKRLQYTIYLIVYKVKGHEIITDNCIQAPIFLRATSYIMLIVVLNVMKDNYSFYFSTINLGIYYLQFFFYNKNFFKGRGFVA